MFTQIVESRKPAARRPGHRTPGLPRLSQRSWTPGTGDRKRHAGRLNIYEQPLSIRAVARAGKLVPHVVAGGHAIVVCGQQVDVVLRERERIPVERQPDEPLANELIARGILTEQQTAAWRHGDVVWIVEIIGGRRYVDHLERFGDGVVLEYLPFACGTAVGG